MSHKWELTSPQIIDIITCDTCQLEVINFWCEHHEVFITNNNSYEKLSIGSTATRVYQWYLMGIDDEKILFKPVEISKQHLVDFLVQNTTWVSVAIYILNNFNDESYLFYLNANSQYFKDVSRELLSTNIER